MKFVKHVKSQLPFANARKRSKGFISLETGLVLVFIAIVLGGVILAFSGWLRRNSVSSNVQAMTFTAGAAKANFGQANRYAAVDTAVAVRGHLLPEDLRDGAAATATNSFGGAITFAPVNLTGTADGLGVTWNNVSSNQCSDIVYGIKDAARQISIGGTVVKPTDADIVDVTLGAACEAAGTVPILMVVGRS